MLNPTLPAGGSAQTSNGRTNEHAPAKGSNVRELFRKFASHTSVIVGSPWSFLLAVLVILAWAVTGPIFHFSDTWQLVINTGTTIVTFLMVFLIQNTQNRDARAIHLKLDELIKGNRRARNAMVDLENCTEEELTELEQEFARVRKKAELAKKQHGPGAPASTGRER